MSISWHMRDRIRTWLLGIWSAAALLYLFIPIFIVILTEAAF